MTYIVSFIFTYRSFSKVNFNFLGLLATINPNSYKLNLHAFLITHFAFICEASANILKVGPNGPPPLKA